MVGESEQLHLDAADGESIEPDLTSGEPHVEVIPTRWQRLRRNRTLQIAAVGGLLALGSGVAFAIGQQDGGKQLRTAVTASVVKPAKATVNRAGTVGEVVAIGKDLVGRTADVIKRASPVQHAVGGYSRMQRHGPGRMQVKAVVIALYMRGGAD